MKLKHLVLVLSLFSMVACKTAVEKMLATGSPEEKEKAAKEYFEDKKYFKASPLYKSLLSDYSGTAKVEEAFYYYAMCDYHLKAYYTAAYELKRLVQRFPRSQYAEKASYYAAMSYYEASPIYQLDQEPTYKAIEEFQLFLDRYPSSEFKDKVNQKVEELTEKLEKKAFEQANLYFKTEYYKSAIVDFQSVLDEFPDTDRKYEIKLLQIESAYNYALQSVEKKQIKRLEECIDFADKFVAQYKRYDDAKKYLEQAEGWSVKATDMIQKLQYSIPEFYLRKKKYDDAITEWEKLKNGLKSEEKQAINEKIISTKFRRASDANESEQIALFQDYLKTFQKFKTDDLAKKESRNVEYAKRKIIELPAEIPQKLFAQANFEEARAFAKLYIDTAGASTPKDIWKIWYKATYEHGRQLEVAEAKPVFDTLLEVASVQKSEKWIDKAKDKIKPYPILLVKKPYQDKEYKTAIYRAKELVKDPTITSKQKEEIVYLLIASSYKHARKGKKFERPARYESLIKLVDKFKVHVTDTKMLEEINEMKIKAEEKLKAFKEKLD